MLLQLLDLKIYQYKNVQNRGKIRLSNSIDFIQ